MTPSNHLHTYKRLRGQKRAGQALYMCLDPDCTHTEMLEKIVGKRAQCIDCRKAFVTDRYLLRRERVHCYDCTKSPVPGSAADTGASRKPVASVGDIAARIKAAQENRLVHEVEKKE